MFAVIPIHDRNQALRIKRLSISIAAIGLFFVFLLVCLLAGMVDISLWEYMVLAGVLITINLSYYGIIRSGLNLRFKDPSLTMLQWCVMVTLISYVLLHAHPIRSAVMTSYLLTNLFGVFQFSRKEFIFATVLPLLQYGAIILWETKYPPVNYNFRQDIILWIILAGPLIWVSIIGSYIRGMQRKVKDRRIKILESHEEISKQRDEVKQSRDKLQVTLTELEHSHEQMEEVNLRLLESLHYAEMIQRSLLPGMDRLKTDIPNSFFIWMPKDIVGGDIYYTYYDQNGFIIALMDCTGHGIPGAFMTMIAHSEIRKIILDEACHDPAKILKRMNLYVKTVLKKDHDHSLSDEGLDAGVCRVNSKEQTITFSGARMPLFYLQEGVLHTVKGDRQSLGYKDSNVDFCFTNHRVQAMETTRFYMASDGYTDQLGGEKRRRMGTKGFRNLILENAKIPFEAQREKMIQAFLTHQGNNEQQDDVTVICFGLNPPAGRNRS